MKRLFLVAVLFASCSKPEQPPAVTGEINIIPQPQSINRLGGVFELNSQTVISAVSEPELRAAETLARLVAARTGGVDLRIVSEKGKANSIEFIGNDANATDPKLDSAYNLRIAPEGVRIHGTGRGMFYAVQSLAQVISPDAAALPMRLPAAEIDDRPRFEYRGMHLDVARHFMPADFVKRYIDLLARYKFNYFHWHLTDDQGWRIEIKQYPQLTEVGSKRRESALNKADQPYHGDGKPVEGFYTQEEIRDIVEYARARYITIIPEIDMPGHSAAALAAIPEIGCRGRGYPYKVQTAWGAFPDIMCPTSETFTFVQNVLSEVMDMFPDSPYIHIGGDELKFPEQWRESAAVRQLMAAEGLNSNAAVSSYFIRQVSTFLTSRDRKAVGWDEVLDGGPVPDIAVMVWQGAERGKWAALLGHKVIMTPWQSTYFDHPADTSMSERMALGDPVTLEDAYRFDPMPPGLSPSAADNILGGQGCLWTEFIEAPNDAEYMAFPRVLAMAEALWSPKEKKNFLEFYSRLQPELARLDREKLNYRIPRPFGLNSRHLPPGDQALIDLKPPILDAKIYLTKDGSIPTEASLLYRAPFRLDVPPGSDVTVRAIVVQANGRTSAVFDAIFSRFDPLATRQQVPSAQPIQNAQSARSGNKKVEVISRAPTPIPQAPSERKKKPASQIVTPKDDKPVPPPPGKKK